MAITSPSIPKCLLNSPGGTKYPVNALIRKLHFQTLNRTWKTTAWFPSSLVAWDQISARCHSRPVQGKADLTPLCQGSSIRGWSSSNTSLGDSCSSEIWFSLYSQPSRLLNHSLPNLCFVFTISSSCSLATLHVSNEIWLQTYPEATVPLLRAQHLSPLAWLRQVAKYFRILATEFPV